MIFLILFLLPLAAAAVVEYIFCRFPRKRAWRYLPPAAFLLISAAVAWSRYHGWDPEGGGAPMETLLFFPGISALGLCLGTFFGWRIWKKLWMPKVIREKKRK